EASVVERAAGNRALDAGAIGGDELLQVVDGGKAAGRDDWNGDRVGERDRRVDVQSAERAVSVDVGVDDRGDARILEAARHVEHGEVRHIRPAFGRHAAALRIEADGDAAGKFPAGFDHEVRVLHRRRADDDAADAFLEPHLDGGEVADAAAKLR